MNTLVIVPAFPSCLEPGTHQINLVPTRGCAAARCALSSTGRCWFDSGTGVLPTDGAAFLALAPPSTHSAPAWCVGGRVVGGRVVSTAVVTRCDIVGVVRDADPPSSSLLSGSESGSTMWRNARLSRGLVSDGDTTVAVVPAVLAPTMNVELDVGMTPTPNCARIAAGGLPGVFVQAANLKPAVCARVVPNADGMGFVDVFGVPANTKGSIGGVGLLVLADAATAIAMGSTPNANGRGAAAEVDPRKPCTGLAGNVGVAPSVGGLECGACVPSVDNTTVATAGAFTPNVNTGPVAGVNPKEGVVGGNVEAIAPTAVAAVSFVSTGCALSPGVLRVSSTGWTDVRADWRRPLRVPVVFGRARGALFATPWAPEGWPGRVCSSHDRVPCTLGSSHPSLAHTCSAHNSVDGSVALLQPNQAHVINCVCFRHTRAPGARASWQSVAAQACSAHAYLP